MVVCHCFAVNHRDIDAAIASGASTVDDISEHTDAGAGCGGCHPTLCARIGDRHTDACGSQDCIVANLRTHAGQPTVNDTRSGAPQMSAAVR